MISSLHKSDRYTLNEKLRLCLKVTFSELFMINQLEELDNSLSAEIKKLQGLHGEFDRWVEQQQQRITQKLVSDLRNGDVPLSDAQKILDALEGKVTNDRDREEIVHIVEHLCQK